ncbi:MAG: response regulator [Candidatus Peribacteraceae bacterium]|nr:response regulator [Candidatus Peribacteraceae bacterium]
MRNILIAEDEAFIATLYKTHFEQHPNVKVTVVGDGKMAIDALAKEKFDLLLLDLIMPNMDGYEVLAHFKKKEMRLPVVVVLSNLSLDIDKAECRRLGAEDYIVKADNDAPAVWDKVAKYLPAE